MKELTSFKECFTIDLSQWYPRLRTRDYARHFFFDAGYFAVVCYRLARYFMYKKVFPFGKGIPFLPSYFMRLGISRSGCEINFNAEIEEGFMLGHSVGVVIGGGVKIGRKTCVFSCVTIGGRNIRELEKSKDSRYPVIGDEVIVFTGAKILGDVRVGNGATVAANAVVIHAVPDGATAAGVPARVISIGGRTSHS